MNADKKVSLFYEAARRHPDARVKTVVRKINEIERKERQTERLRSELDAASDRRSRMLAESEREGKFSRFLRMMGVRS